MGHGVCLNLDTGGRPRSGRVYGEAHKLEDMAHLVGLAALAYPYHRAEM
jgi:hypothetical protein